MLAASMLAAWMPGWLVGLPTMRMMMMMMMTECFGYNLMGRADEVRGKVGGDFATDAVTAK